MVETRQDQRTTGPPPRRPRRSDSTPRQRRRARKAQERTRSSRSQEPSTAVDDGAGLRAGRRSPGRRHAVTRRRRHRMRTLTLVGIVVLGLVAVGIVLVASGLADRALDLVVPEDPGAADPALEPDDRHPSVVVVTHDETDPAELASHVIVLAHDRDRGEATALLVPTATQVDVPGHGSFPLREAHALGGGSLVAASLENLLDVRFDGVVDLSQQGWAALLTRIGGFEVEVRSQLVDRQADGSGVVAFEPGTQFLDGPRLAEYLAYRGETETELEALPRVQQVLSGMLDRIDQEPEVLDELFADGAPMLGAEDPELVRALLRELAEARSADALTTVTLPVTGLGSGRDDAYRIDRDRVEALVADRFEALRPVEGAGAGRSLQILNGNGIPGIGEQVASRLRDGGYRIVLTGNADSFAYDTTRIVVYDDSQEQLEVARDIQERLGVGEVLVGGTPQSVVDVTIVVGRDFPGE